MLPDRDIHPKEVGSLIKKLIAFIGHNRIENALNKYEASLKSSGPMFREYYLRVRHPWWDSLLFFRKLQRNGKSIRKHLNSALKSLAADAKMTTTLQRHMPEPVKEKYKKNLVDKERAIDYLFEIRLAWHFYLKGCSIIWEDDPQSRQAEFMVIDGRIHFNVECKRISVDIARKIRERDFFRLADKLIPLLYAAELTGRVSIVLNGKLASNDNYLNQVTSEVITVAKRTPTDDSEIFCGSVVTDLKKANGTKFDPNKSGWLPYKNTPLDAYGAIFAKPYNNKLIDPVELIISSTQPYYTLKAIEDRIKRAKNQLNPSVPGLICCLLSGISDLQGLENESGLKNMTNHLLAKNSFGHIVAIGYSSETVVRRDKHGNNLFNNGLVCRNNKSNKFPHMKNYPFLK